MLSHASVIKRPLLERDGVPVAIGFDEAVWSAALR
jgi:arsenate reductase-like glutaredoxin family protein